MASVHARKNKAGEVTSYQVKWRLGGGREAPGQTERFPGTDEGREAAEVFKEAVNAAGQQWPPGWVKGVGYVDPNAAEPDEDRYRFRNYALAFVENKTGVEDHYRRACKGDLERWIFPTFENCDVRSTEHFNHDTVQAWVRKLEQTKVYRGQKPKNGEPKWRLMSPKTIRNLHGLLFSVLQRAVEAEPPLRARNPCELTRLPRTDDDSVDGEDIEFLTPEEVEGVLECLERRSDRELCIIKYGTGMRWGEISALCPAQLIDWNTGQPKIRIMRAWKKDGKGGYKIGPPKSRKSRRTIRVSLSVVDAVQRLGGEDGENGERLFFTGEAGQRLHYSTFYDRWMRAVKRAKALGLLPRHKNPTPHDLRHSHAAVLISEGRGLTYVQRRLGHESIKTTSDTYGHLLPEADDEAMEAIDRSLGRRQPDAGFSEAEDRNDRSRVHVVHMDGEFKSYVQAFWSHSDASAVAEQWQLDHPEDTVRVETMAADWWRRQQTNGLKGVRSEMPQRLRIWVGSALYMPDGSPFSTGTDIETIAARWTWEWEEQFTGRDVLTSVTHEPGLLALTQARAWGCSREKVTAAFASVREEALSAAGAHPARGSSGEPVT